MSLTDDGALRCDVCGNEVIRYYEDRYGHISCDRHDYYACYCCGRICRPAECVQIASYGLFCPDCQKRRVERDSLLRISGRVNEFFRRQRIRIPEYRLRLISEERMIEETGNTNIFGLAFRKRPYEIHIIRNLSRMGFAGVLAHEVLHLWQYEHDFDTPDMMCEGMCELGSYLFMSTIDRQEADAYRWKLARNQDRIYGDGFRLFHSIYRKFGWPGVAKALLLRNGKKAR